MVSVRGGGGVARLLEFQGKGLMAQAGLPVPRGRPAGCPDDAQAAAVEIGGSVVLKAQVCAGGRGKAAAVRFVDSPAAARAAAADLFGSTIKGFSVRQVLVEEWLDSTAEYYVGLTIDPARSGRRALFMFSTHGGESGHRSADDRRSCGRRRDGTNP